MTTDDEEERGGERGSGGGGGREEDLPGLSISGMLPGTPDGEADGSLQSPRRSADDRRNPVSNEKLRGRPSLVKLDFKEIIYLLCISTFLQ